MKRTSFCPPKRKESASRPHNEDMKSRQPATASGHTPFPETRKSISDNQSKDWKNKSRDRKNGSKDRKNESCSRFCGKTTKKREARCFHRASRLLLIQRYNKNEENPNSVSESLTYSIFLLLTVFTAVVAGLPEGPLKKNHRFFTLQRTVLTEKWCKFAD